MFLSFKTSFRTSVFKLYEKCFFSFRTSVLSLRASFRTSVFSFKDKCFTFKNKFFKF